jgi:hypothetical protein
MSTAESRSTQVNDFSGLETYRDNHARAYVCAAPASAATPEFQTD